MEGYSKSKNAHSIGLVFKQFYLPHGGELYIIGQDKILGAFVGDINNKANGKFATTPLPGESILLEYYEALNQEVEKCFAKEKLGFLLGGNRMTPSKKPVKIASDEVRLAIRNVNHGFRPYTKNFGDAGSCNIDVACEPNIAGVHQIIHLHSSHHNYFRNGKLIQLQCC